MEWLLCRRNKFGTAVNALLSNAFHHAAGSKPPTACTALPVLSTSHKHQASMRVLFLGVPGKLFLHQRSIQDIQTKLSSYFLF